MTHRLQWPTRPVGALLFLLMIGPAAVAQKPLAHPVHHELQIALQPATRLLRVEDRITLSANGLVEVAVGLQFDLQHATLDGLELPAPEKTNERQRWSLELRGGANHQLVLRYAGHLAPLVDTDHRGTLEALAPMAAERGSYLPAGTGWYAQVGDLGFSYRLALDLPPGQRGLAPGQLIQESDTMAGYRATFEFAQPIDGIDLMAGPYQVRERMLARNGSAPIRLRTWFHPEIAELATGYLDALARYLTLYSGQIGEYPFTDFSVVSSPLPTGFGMPTLTYLGIDVLQLPFIKSTSLGHEVLHSWWGNGVYVDYSRGNWCEGLTTFMADYAYKEQEGPDSARAMRLEWLRDFSALPRDQDFPLRQFTARTHGASQIVGYHKAAFVFLMLRERLGSRTFDEALRQFWRDNRFRRASWRDLQRAFERASGAQLDTFFEQWLARAGAPEIRIEDATLRRTGDRFEVRSTLAQGAPPYVLAVPFALQTDAGRRDEVANLADARATFILFSPSRPGGLLLDPDLFLFRRLDPRELAPILRQVMLQSGTRVCVQPVGAVEKETAQRLARAVLEHAPSTFDCGPPLFHAPVLLIGIHDDVDRMLATWAFPPRPAAVGYRGSAQVWTARSNDARVVAVVSVRDWQSLDSLARPLPHYGRQSWLVFEGSKVIDRGIWPLQPIVWRFAE